MKRYSIKDMQEIAMKKGGKCLSGEYKNSRIKLEWQCKNGHIFKMHFNAVQNGHWCPKCRHKVPELRDIKLLAEQKHGKCASENYINSKTHMEWQCKNGHTWKATWANIKKGYWCPYCAGQGKYTIVRLQNIAKERGGKLISKTAGNAKTKLKWQCKNGHIWEGQTGQIVAGRWCPECSSGLGERICRTYFEQIFQHKFPKIYPDWLKTQDGNRLELDGYCESLKIAFEHHGRQHYEIDGRFTKNQKDFKKRNNYDELKKKSVQAKK